MHRHRKHQMCECVSIHKSECECKNNPEGKPWYTGISHQNWLVARYTSGNVGVRRNRTLSFQESAQLNLSAESSQASVESTTNEFIDEDLDNPDFNPSSLSRVSIMSNKVVKVVDNKPSVVGKYMWGNIVAGHSRNTGSCM